ncbi:hypothetical protein [Sinorhizobium fredii]|nr:hypothetical protein [Sinorhizobium fredii]AWI57085.1 hypothetical protein AB395_00001424 [Sinorhizobium fredii CCBAU 45436]
MPLSVGNCLAIEIVTGTRYGTVQMPSVSPSFDVGRSAIEYIQIDGNL